MLTFIGIGVARCGTSWTNRHLSLHPKLHLLPKETNVFLTSTHAKSDPWKPTGEWSPVYFTRRQAAENIFEHNHTAKLLVNLRNPVDRAWSWHNFRLQRGVISQSTDFESLFFSEAQTYTQPGMYANHLKMWFALFDQKQVHVTIFEDLIEKPLITLNNICRFIGVGKFAKKNLSSGDRSGPKPKMPDDLRRKVRQYYAEQIEGTKDLLKINLPW